MKRPRRLGRGGVDVVPDLIDLARHLAQHFGVLVFDAQFEGFGAVHSGFIGQSKGDIQTLWAKASYRWPRS